MSVLDSINTAWGKGHMRPARVPVTPEWGMRQELEKPNYTTRLGRLWRRGVK